MSPDEFLNAVMERVDADTATQSLDERILRYHFDWYFANGKSAGCSINVPVLANITDPEVFADAAAEHVRHELARPGSEAKSRNFGVDCEGKYVGIEWEYPIEER